MTVETLGEGGVRGLGTLARRTGWARAGLGLGLLLYALALWLPGLTLLPPMDRDEPRFAQASKQMIETGDLVAIRFGDEARNKKPVGIYWLQAAAVEAGEALGVRDARRQIWLYRLPSLAAALATVFFTVRAAAGLVSPAGAWLAGFLMASTLLLGVEARLATTDAVVAATVAAGMAALSRAWLARAEGARVPLATVVLFWAAMGIGLLIKGPITPLVPALAALALSAWTRSGGWLKALRPLSGVLLCLLIVAPWFVLILVRTQGAFLSEAVGHDMLGKVAGGQEMHGAPPGTYLLAFFLSGWPLAPFAALAVPAVWRHRSEPAIAFLLAWLVPSWIVYEAVPTKLFHYVMPLYPALAILAVAGLERAAASTRFDPRRATLPFSLLLGLVPLLIAAAVGVLAGRLWTATPLVVAATVLAMAASLGLAAMAVVLKRRGALAASVGAGTAAAAPVALLVFGLLLTAGVAPGLALSGRLAAAGRDALGPSCPAPAYATVGDREPSLMFLTDTRLLMTDPLGAAHFMDDAPCRVAFVATKDEVAFASALDPSAGVRRAATVQGMALNGAKPLDIDVYVRPWTGP